MPTRKVDVREHKRKTPSGGVIDVKKHTRNIKGRTPKDIYNRIENSHDKIKKQMVKDVRTVVNDFENIDFNDAQEDKIIAIVKHLYGDEDFKRDMSADSRWNHIRLTFAGEGTQFGLDIVKRSSGLYKVRPTIYSENLTNEIDEIESVDFDVNKTKRWTYNYEGDIKLISAKYPTVSDQFDQIMDLTGILNDVVLCTKTLEKFKKKLNRVPLSAIRKMTPKQIENHFGKGLTGMQFEF